MTPQVHWQRSRMGQSPLPFRLTGP